MIKPTVSLRYNTQDFYLRLKQGDLEKVCLEYESSEVLRVAPARGLTEWTAAIGVSRLSVGWEWSVGLDGGIFIPERSVVVSNAMLVGELGYDLGVGATEVALRKVITGLAWQSMIDLRPPSVQLWS